MLLPLAISCEACRVGSNRKVRSGYIIFDDFFAVDIYVTPRIVKHAYHLITDFCNCKTKAITAPISWLAFVLRLF